MIKMYPEIEQGSDAWFAARCGLLTASEMKHIITPTLKIANNDKQRAHLFELAGQRITKYVEPSYIGDDMLRGNEDEIEAIILYSEKISDIERIGFISNNKWGFTLGYSPDGLVGESGLIEIKSRKQKYQIETIASNEVPIEYVIQIQTGLMVSERAWCDYISYCGGLPMWIIRVFPDDKIQNAIAETAEIFEENLALKIKQYNYQLKEAKILIPTERRIELEITL